MLCKLLFVVTLFIDALSALGIDEGHISSNSSSYFALCLIVKNDPDIVEWIDYHQKMGCSKIYVFDHSSHPPLNSTIVSYIDSGLVDYNYISGKFKPNPQIKVYGDCIERYRNRHTFMVCI